MNKIIKILLLWIPLVAYLSLIYYLSSLSKIRLGSQIPDYMLHSAEYFVLSILVVRAFNSGLKKKVKRNALIWGIIFSIAYAASDEIHQLYVPQRTASMIDIVSDAAGILLAIICIFLFQRYFLPSLKLAENVSGSK